MFFKETKKQRKAVRRNKIISAAKKLATTAPDRRKRKPLAVHETQLLGMATHLGLKQTPASGYTSITGSLPTCEVRVPRQSKVDRVEVVGFIPPASIDERNVHRIGFGRASVEFTYAKNNEKLVQERFGQILACLKQ
jgi:hypothetical protein